MESKAAATKQEIRRRAAKILDLFAYKLRQYAVSQGLPPSPYIPSHEDIKNAYTLATMESLKLGALEKKMDEYFRRLNLILQEDAAGEVSLTHFLKWVHRL